MKNKMYENGFQALKWIIEILHKNNIPYRIGGGVAAHFYGSERSVKDIDITIPGKYFPVIVSEASEYITAGPKHGSNEKWDCDYIALNYNGQEIDITDIDTLKMSNKGKTEWIQTKDAFCKFPNHEVEIEGIKVSLIDPRDLVAYKKELDGDHQSADIVAIEKYIIDNKIYTHI
jgi:hypothetical protein